VSEAEPLLELLRELKRRDYHFVTVTPATHASVLARRAPDRLTLRDIFGWNMPFDESELDPVLLEVLRSADALEDVDGRLKSRVRVASLDGDLFLHSSFPTDARDSVFLGPDTYRFARFIRERLPKLPMPRRIIDMGAGSGAGGIVAARCTGCRDIALVDVNPAALRMARINAAEAGIEVELIQSDRVPEGADVIVANPPYMIDSAQRAYRDGGELLGGAVALNWVEQALERVRPGGAILLYTGAAVTNGEAPLVRAIERACAEAGASLYIEEIDSDVFGEELAQPAYREVERISAVGVAISAPRSLSPKLDP